MAAVETKHSDCYLVDLVLFYQLVALSLQLMPSNGNKCGAKLHGFSDFVYQPEYIDPNGFWQVRVLPKFSQGYLSPLLFEVISYEAIRGSHDLAHVRAQGA